MLQTSTLHCISISFIDMFKLTSTRVVLVIGGPTPSLPSTRRDFFISLLWL